MKLDVQVQGLTELNRALHELPERVARNALRSAVNAGATEVKREAIQRAPVDTGATKANLYQKQIREKSGQYQQTFYVGVRRGIARYANNKKNRQAGIAGKAYRNEGTTWYWRLVEFGTSKMVAKPFLRPAFEATKQAAVDRIAEKLDERIQKFATELAKK